MTLSGAMTMDQSGFGSDGNEGVLRIPKALALMKPHHLMVLLSYPGNSVGNSNPSAEMQSVYSTLSAE